MAFSVPDLPAGWPWSLWFFIITIAVYLLQRFPLTGVFLMVAGAAFWSVILVNLGVIGIGVEAVIGRVSRLWLIVPLAYFGGYYLLYAKDQAALAQLRAEYARFNNGKSLPFDPAAQDLLLDDERGSLLSTNSFVPYYGLGRAFSSKGRMALVGDSEACALLRGNDVYRSAGIYSSALSRSEAGSKRPEALGFCSITAPGEPDRPVVRVAGASEESNHARMPVTTQTFHIRDEASRQEIAVKSAFAAPLKRFPMPVMGCALNSGGGSWDCFHGFMRSTVTPVAPTGQKYGGGTVIVAAALGLKKIQDYAPLATGPERFRAIGDAADAKLVATEIALLEQMLANPAANLSESGFRHLTNKPDVIGPYADRMFAALGQLQGSGARVSGTGRDLWRLVAALPDLSLEPHRAKLVEWLKPENAREWTVTAYDVYTRLDVTDPIQREIVLNRLETKRGDLQTNLLPQFCRLGDKAPDDVKRRLLALWEAKGLESAELRRKHRPQDHVVLYLTLARMGLKAQAGKVEQRYYGPTFLAIWNEVTPETHADLCFGWAHEISNHFSRR